MLNTTFSIFPNEFFFDLTLFQYGWESCVTLHSYGPVKRNHFLFHYVLSGKGLLSSFNSAGESIDYHLSAGEGFLISPKQINTYMADQVDPWEYVWLEFDGMKAKKLLERAGLTFNSPIYKSNNENYQNTMKNEMLYIVENSKNPSVELIGHLYLFVNALLESSASTKKTIEGRLCDFYIREALTFIEQNYQLDITIEDVASFCNLSRGHLGKIFRDELHTSLQSFLLHYRMNKACELLKTTNQSIGDIAMQVSYQNQMHFSRAFKKVFEISPKEWRSRNKISKPT